MEARLSGALALLLLIAGAPSVLAITCNGISQANYDTCMEIINSNITDMEKSLIISNLDYSEKFYPEHSFIYDKNTNLQISSAPDGVQYYNGIFVRNAWMSIFTAMPSVLYNNSLYVPTQTKVQTGFNYQIQTPSNYYSSGYPSTSQGDCKRIYTLTRNDAENKVYVNNNYQGSGKLVQINVNQDSQIKANYLINVAYSIDHYYWQRYCSRYSNGYCVRHSYRCAYDYNEIKSDSIPITDYLNVKSYNNSLTGDVRTILSYSESTKIEPNFSNSIELSFQDSYFKKYEFVYDVNYSKAPYYVYTLTAKDYKEEQISNILKDGTALIVKNPNNCTINAWDFFNTIQKSCFIGYNPIDFSVDTDRLTYIVNETINVSVYPQNISVNLTYGSQSKLVKGNSTFIAESLKNKVQATYGNFETEKIIFVQDSDKFAIIRNLSFFGLLNYIVYAVLRKCFGGII
jgi:hypothetical protein